MLDIQAVVTRHTASVAPGDRYAVRMFDGGIAELNRFLNHLPAGWKLVSVSLPTSVIHTAAALFEIDQSTNEPKNGHAKSVRSALA